GLPGLASAATTPAALKTVLSVSPAPANVGQKVTAQVAKSTIPSGDHVKTISLNWGDGSKAGTLASVTAEATHTYQGAGQEPGAASITDTHGVTSKATTTETVKLPAGSYAGGVTGYSGGLSFFVSNDQTRLQNVNDYELELTCTPGSPIWVYHNSVDSV